MPTRQSSPDTHRPAHPDTLDFLEEHGPPGELLLCAVVGSHMVGLARPDSDLDLRGIHQSPTARVLNLYPDGDTHHCLITFRGRSMDWTSHELSAALRLLLKGNGNLLERITSPLQQIDHPAVHELQTLARDLLSCRYHGHYRGHFRAMQKAHIRSGQTKSLLASIRLALTGVHLLETGRVECHIDRLLEIHPLTGVEALLDFHRTAPKGLHPPSKLVRAVTAHWTGLESRLNDAASRSPLPTVPASTEALDAWLLRRRLHFPGASAP